MVRWVLNLQNWRIWQAWIERHPWPAWVLTGLVVLAIVGIEVSYWPRNDFPAATWHHRPRGDDIELAQAAAARAGWWELAGYWFGRTIQGHGYYRPLTSWLFVGEYRLWGTDDRTWAWVNIFLHLGVVTALLWSAWALLEGSQAQRLLTGAGSALLLGAPGQADRTVQKWILSWWPCQSEHFSLLAGLCLLGAVALHVRAGKRGWAVLAVVAFAVAVFFKEMGFVAGVGACGILLRRPRSRALLGVLALEGLALFALRWAALQHAGGIANSPPTGRQGFIVWAALADAGEMFHQASPQLVAIAAGVMVALLAPRLARGRSLTRWERVALGGVSYFVVAVITIGPPWEGLFQRTMELTLFWGWHAAILVGLALAVRQWPIPELIGVYALSELAVSGFSATFGWYQYWGSAFGALLTSAGLISISLLIGRRLVISPTKTPDSAGSLVSSRQ